MLTGMNLFQTETISVSFIDRECSEQRMGVDSGAILMLIFSAVVGRRARQNSFQVLVPSSDSFTNVLS